LPSCSLELNESSNSVPLGAMYFAYRTFEELPYHNNIQDGVDRVNTLMRYDNGVTNFDSPHVIIDVNKLRDFISEIHSIANSPDKHYPYTGLYTWMTSR
jgi:hypothetical protein